MKFAVSNIALPAFSHHEELHKLNEMGLSGLEVAPSRVWQDTWHALSAAQVANYRKQVEHAGLNVIGLHSLIYDHPELGLFISKELRAKTLEFFVHLSAVCRDLGGKTLIWGGGRHRKALPEEQAFEEAISFMNDLMVHIQDHGTCFCFEPLGPTDSDFINSVFDSIRIVEAVNHPALRIQLDAKALVENDEVELNIFKTAAPYLVHFHANEPGLGVLSSTGPVPHKKFGKYLNEIAYDRYVSIEQRMFTKEEALENVSQSMSILKSNYHNG